MRDRSPRDPTSPASDPEYLDETRGNGPPAGLALDPPEPSPEHPPEIPVERLDPDALKVIYRLRHMRHQAFLVGGCVRDLLVGAHPKDFDVATDAHPGEVRAIFRNCRLIGRRFRLAHVYFRGGKVIEVATFRKNPIDVAEDVGEEGDLLITRDNVFGTAEEDAVRRDFTVNGLFYDPATGEVIDYVGGRADLEAHRVATIGDPEIRIREDPVRALRAIRFAARLGFTIAPDTFEAMRRHAGELSRCAPPRVLEEIFKILRCGGSARAFELLRASGALSIVLPPLAAAFDGWDHAGRRSFTAHLAALDRLVRSGEEVSEAVLLGALLTHLGPVPGAVEEPGAEGAGPSARRESGSDPLLANLVQSARLPRKVAERARLALHAQRLFRDPPRRRRRRGRGLAGQPYFEDAVQLLQIAVQATGEGQDVLERWTAEPGADERRGRSAADEAPHRGHDGERHHGRDRKHGPSRPSAPAVAAASEDALVADEAEPGEEEIPTLEVDAVASEPGHAPPTVEVDGTAPEGPAAEGQPGRRRRRRRGGRRRRRRGAHEPAEGSGGPPPPVAAS
jgi:poly(A) polymerase